ASDNVGEGSSAVDPELPPPVLCHRLTFHLSLLLLILGRRQRSMPAPLSPARYFLLQVISHGRADHATAPWPPGCAGRSPRGSPALHPACRDNPRNRCLNRVDRRRRFLWHRCRRARWP